MPRFDRDAWVAELDAIKAEQAELWELAVRRGGTLSRASAEARRLGHMKRISEREYATNPPKAGSARDIRLRALLSRDQVADLAGLSRETVLRAERASDAGSRDAVRATTWRALARGLSRGTGEKVRLTDIRPAKSHA